MRSSTKATYPFPYVGAGDASYFEWVGVTVVFEIEPSEEEKGRIAVGKPAPLELNWNGSVLLVESGQFAHVEIAEHYQVPGGKHPSIEEDWESERVFWAADSQVTAFNRHLEEWLQSAHQVSPVLFALRLPDYEADGTEMSEWGRWSEERIPELLADFDDVLETFDINGPRGRVLVQLLHFQENETEQTLEAEHVEILKPGTSAIASFLEGDIQPFIALHRRPICYVRRARFLLANQLNLADDKVLQTTLSYVDHVLRQNSDGKRELRKLSNRLAAEGYERMVKAREPVDVRTLIALFDRVTQIGCADLGAYCNALWPLQNDNSGFAIDPARNRTFLERCLPFAPQNPGIYLNAACLYVEMGELDTAYQLIAEMIEHRDADKRGVLALAEQQIRSEEMFAAFRENTEVLSLFAKM